MKKALLIIIIIAAIGLGVNYILIEKEVSVEVDSEEMADWKSVGLTDVLTDEKFKISDFAGQKILLESFAVWCPTCLKQQKEMKRLGGVIHISLDTDPNEDVALVKGHALDNGLDWRFAVSPVEVTRALIDEFGIGVVNAPAAPVILICEDQSTRFLGKGVKTAEKLKTELQKGC